MSGAEEKRRVGRPKKEAQKKAVFYGTLTGVSAELLPLLINKGQGLSAGLRLLAKSEHAEIFFEDMDAVEAIIGQNRGGGQEAQKEAPKVQKKINQPQRAEIVADAHPQEDGAPRDPNGNSDREPGAHKTKEEEGNPAPPNKGVEEGWQ